LSAQQASTIRNADSVSVPTRKSVPDPATIPLSYPISQVS
jgi:hypothetical protein